MSARQDAAQVLAAHTVRGVKDGLWHCECGTHWPLEGDSVDPYMRHLVDTLAAAGLLVTPESERNLTAIERAYACGLAKGQERTAEHDRQVAARALRRYVRAARENRSLEAWGADEVLADIEDWASCIESGVLDGSADRIERQEDR